MLKKLFIFGFVAFIIFALLLWSSPLIFLRGSLGSGKTNQNINQNNTMINSLKKILMVVAYTNFRDEEYFEPKGIFENGGYYVETISNRTGQATSAGGEVIDISKTPADITPEDYAGIVFVGGPGMSKELDNKLFQKLAQDFFKQNKLVAAICIAPALLAKAGILQGKRATVWSSPSDQSAINILKENGALYEEKALVKDGNIITANGPESAQSFGEAILDYLSQSF